LPAWKLLIRNLLVSPCCNTEDNLIYLFTVTAANLVLYASLVMSSLVNVFFFWLTWLDFHTLFVYLPLFLQGFMSF
jgi:hypothetical protein